MRTDRVCTCMVDRSIVVDLSVVLMSAPATTTAAAVDSLSADAASLTVSGAAAANSSKEQPKQQVDGANAESSDEEEGDAAAGADGAAGAEKKKKKKKKAKKKKAAAPAVNACGVHLFCQGGRNPVPNAPSLINGNKAVIHRQQLSPVSVPIADMYQNKVFPQGEIMNHGGEL